MILSTKCYTVPNIIIYQMLQGIKYYKVLHFTTITSTKLNGCYLFVRTYKLFCTCSASRNFLQKKSNEI